jgi:hypothetical protein
MVAWMCVQQRRGLLLVVMFEHIPTAFLLVHVELFDVPSLTLIDLELSSDSDGTTYYSIEHMMSEW